MWCHVHPPLLHIYYNNTLVAYFKRTFVNWLLYTLSASVSSRFQFVSEDTFPSNCSEFLFPAVGTMCVCVQFMCVLRCLQAFSVKPSPKMMMSMCVFLPQYFPYEDFSFFLICHAYWHQPFTVWFWYIHATMYFCFVQKWCIQIRMGGNSTVRLL